MNRLASNGRLIEAATATGHHRDQDKFVPRLSATLSSLLPFRRRIPSRESSPLPTRRSKKGPDDSMQMDRFFTRLLHCFPPARGRPPNVPLTSHEHSSSPNQRNEIRILEKGEGEGRGRSGETTEVENRSLSSLLSFRIISLNRERESERERVQSAGRGPLKERRGISRLSSERGRSGAIFRFFIAPLYTPAACLR